MSHPSSRRQRAANRRNARLSTGPKTESGRARVSQNAFRHGLSRPVAPNEPNVCAVAEALASELDTYAANDLARVIVQFERVERELMGTLAGSIPEEHHLKDPLTGLTLTDDILELLPRYFSPSEISELSEGFISQPARASQDPVDRIHRARRYWKRAANQLVKQARDF
mgnify:FL=1